MCSVVRLLRLFEENHMRPFSFLTRRSLSYCGVLVVFCGCSASPPLGSLKPEQNAAGHPDYGASWMAPDAASRKHLLYVSDVSAGDVYALSLPTGKLVGKLTGFNQPLGDCVDGAGNVFIVISQSAQVRVYKHGAKQPFNVLGDSGYYPLGCSVDPTTGNLAVTNIIGSGNGSQPGNVAIYTKAKGTPKYYSDASIYQYGYCTYDQQGNLYIDGITPPSDNPQVGELPKGSKTFQSITLNQSLGGNNISALLWDGTYLAVSSQDSAVIYQFAISGSTGTEVSSTQLTGSSGVGAFWIENAKLYAPVYKDSIGSIGVYPYPAGGKPSKGYYAVVSPWAATISNKAQ
jgi:hypothetical protein